MFINEAHGPSSITDNPPTRSFGDWLLKKLQLFETCLRDHPGIQFALELLIFIILLYHINIDLCWLLFYVLAVGIVFMIINWVCTELFDDASY